MATGLAQAEIIDVRRVAALPDENQLVLRAIEASHPRRVLLPKHELLQFGVADDDPPPAVGGDGHQEPELADCALHPRHRSLRIFSQRAPRGLEVGRRNIFDKEAEVRGIENDVGRQGRIVRHPLAGPDARQSRRTVGSIFGHFGYSRPRAAGGS